jgi:hypothetical protein
MLARSQWYSASTGNWSTHDYYFADGNGSITSMVDTNQSIVAIYRYDAFGRTLSESGSMASVVGPPA